MPDRAPQRTTVSRLLPPGRDIAIALAVAALGEVEVWVADIPGPRGVSTGAALALGLSLAWRRSAPLAVALTVTAALNAQFLLGVPHGAPAVPVLALVIAMYALGARATAKRAVLGGAVVVIANWVVLLTQPPLDATDFPFTAILSLAPLILGRALSTTEREAREAHERAQRAELEREHAAAQAVAQERARIARELHDVVSHSISVMGLQAGAVRRLLPAGNDELEQTLRSVEETGRDALNEMRRLLGIVRAQAAPAALEPQPGLDRLDDLVDETRRAGLELQLRREGERTPLSRGLDLAAYRIVQEALTNVRRHAQGAAAEVLIRQTSHELEIIVIDSGPGLDGQSDAGHGIIGMRERASLYGGELHIDDAPGGGCRLRARLALSGPAGVPIPPPDYTSGAAG
ncbi:MAG: hypothetical protein QOJ89_3806 [bacterium]|jgi:signal transduction histidine kinase